MNYAWKRGASLLYILIGKPDNKIGNKKTSDKLDVGEVARCPRQFEVIQGVDSIEMLYRYK